MKALHTTKKAGPYMQCCKNALLFLLLLICTQRVNAQTICNAGFTYTVVNGNVTFTNTSTSNNAFGSLKYDWNFGDGSGIVYQKNPTHQFSASGFYAVELKLWDITGNCADTFVDSVNVTGVCNADFDAGSSGLNANFRPRTMEPGLSYSWNFGDSSSSTDSIPQHSYSAEGTYTVCLTTYNSASNCSDTVCKNIKISLPLACHASFYTNVSKTNASFYADTTFAGYANASFTWNFGDGSSLSYNKVSATHKYASVGVYTVCLTVTNGSCTDMFCDSIQIYDTTPIPNSNIYGNVYLGSSTFADAAKIYLIQYVDSSLVLVDTTDLLTNDTMSYFLFQNKLPGMYFIKAALTTSSANYANYLPTYSDTGLVWYSGHTIILEGDDEYANVYMRAGTNPGGSGFIGGKVSQGANKKEGDPLENIQVMLFDANKNPVAYTYSNAKGEFSFNNLAFGTYEVYTEVIGLKTKSANVAISQANPKIENVEVRVSSSGITTSIRTKLTEDFFAQPKLYPNPAQSNLYLETDMKKSQHAEIVIYNIIGQQVYTENIDLKQGKQTHNIATDKLPAGLYMLQLKNALGTDELQYKFIKSDK